MESRRIKAIIEYDGTFYHGFQRQKDGVPTIQGELEKALFRLSAESIDVFPCGRTDAGVHALEQVIHFDINSKFSTDEIQGALNYFLKEKSIAILSAAVAEPNFHARFDAKLRTYLYRIICRKAPLVLEANRAWRIKHNLDVGKMQDAAKLFLGRHNFNSFRSTECQADSPIKTIDSIDVEQDDNLINIFVSAKSFLHNQIRIMVSALQEVGADRWSKQDITNALNAEDRTFGPSTAPACGLYFLEVEY